ncbi:MAG: T9SS type A sorting domain-containing protein [Saprospiraceae bacterium]|nr:T9SS type A sorting domain-containing protein [Saprospiraceae bacterium]
MMQLVNFTKHFFGVFTLVCLFSITSLQAQRECSAAELYEQMMQSSPSFKNNRQRIEAYIQQYATQNRAINQVITIPVVFHIIHNGDAVGAGENIPENLICEQLDQLNDDFRAMNADIGNVPSEFVPLIGDAMVQFCFASVDPEGNATDGIIRWQFNRATWTNDQFDAEVKPSTIWNRNNYLNFWTADLEGGLLGYAQFPGGAASTDGIVVDNTTVGSLVTPNPNGNAFSRGRTATHEIGHWLDLRHIWGDDCLLGIFGSCTGSDLVDDTPNQFCPSSGCPNYPKRSQCSQSEMFMNYMDYTDDNCMHMFSDGQITRIRATVDPGGFRASLASSPAGCTNCGTVVEPTCTDGIRNGQETGVDCGGPDCAPCMTQMCPTPTGLSTTNIARNRATLNWTAVSEANNYTVELRPVGTTTWSVFMTNTNSYRATGLARGTDYEWRVRSNCDGSSSEFSVIATFRTTGGAATPTCSDGIQNGNETGVDCGGSCAPCMMDECTVPTGTTTTNIGTTQATLNWNAVNGANNYTTRLRPVGTTRWNTRSVTGTSTIASPLQAGRTYEWQVSANCSGGASAFSASTTFTTASSAAALENRGDEGTISFEAAGFETTVFPSPTSDVLNIKANKAINTIQIIDVTGRVVRAIQLDVVSLSTVISVSQLADGQYFVRIQAGTDLEIVRFVKQ